MASDASIYGMIRPQAQVQGPLDTYAQGMQLKALIGQGDLQDLQRRQLERGIADEESTAAAYRESGGDPVRLKDLLYGRGLYKPAMAAEKNALEAEAKRAAMAKDKAAAGKSQFDVQIGQLERGASILASAKDQPSYDTALRVMADTFGPGAIEKMPPQFDPGYVQASIQRGMTRAQQLADQRAAQGQAITMRGQDMTAATAAAGQGVTMRGQDIGATTAREGHGVTRRGQDLSATVAREGHAATAAKEKAPTDVENVSAGYAARMRNSAQILADLEKKGIGKPELTETAFSAVGNKMGANISMSPERQQYRQAQEDWVRAKLRKESGAVIADEEMDREIRVYFPQIGDDKKTVTQKANSRKQAELGMAQAAGKAKISDPVTPGQGRIKFLGFE